MPLALLPHYTVRALGPDDRSALAVTFERLSAESRRRRFLGPKPRLSDRELTFLTDVDQVRQVALAAIDERDGSIVAVARYHAWADRDDVADVAVAVIDEWQGCRLGTRLARQVIQHARANGFTRLTGTTYWDNRPARRMLRTLGFNTVAFDGPLLDMEMRLAE
ncbi:GNAT family N-acetyltransferase [Candidatus Solirubrobacter pratensis]|uniref:GNAT family N-acetyltransferase n=1 Tax=Candidatus Solirubrobacter pratensis TaxID=1298857 RepID=UPI0004077BF5|nr:GNAT family N-acetyltransferase [Candidatus Solirubrobacter pratensis]